MDLEEVLGIIDGEYLSGYQRNEEEIKIETNAKKDIRLVNLFNQPIGDAEFIEAWNKGTLNEHTVFRKAILDYPYGE